MAASLEICLGPNLTPQQADRIRAQSKEAVIFALLQQAKMLREQHAAVPADVTPATPSGQTPTYQNPPAKIRSKTRGRKKGRPGRRRPTPGRFDDTKHHRAEVCPDCGGELNRCTKTRARYVEDIPENLQPKVQLWSPISGPLPIRSQALQRGNAWANGMCLSTTTRPSERFAPPS